MHTQLFLATWNPAVTSGHFIGVAVLLSCLLLAVLVATVVLICKVARAHRRHKDQVAAQTVEVPNDAYTNYAMAPIFLLGAIPQTVNTLITVLMIALAAASLLLLILLIVFRARGYEFLPRAAQRLSQQRAEESEVLSAYADAAEATDETVAESDPDAALEETQSYDEYMAAMFAKEEASLYADEAVEETDEPDEEAEQTDEFDLSDTFEEDFAADEEPDDEAAEVFAEVEEDEPTAEEAEDEPVEVTGEIIPAAAAVNTAETVAEGAPAPAGSTGPVKIVEKVVTETYKEVIREVPAEGTAKEGSTASDRTIEKLTDLLEQALQMQKTSESAPAKAENEDSRRVSGMIVDDDDDDDEDDEDEAEDAVDAQDGDDIDDEENDVADDHFTGNERIIGFDEETGMYIVAHYRKSFEAKLIQARPNIKKYYSELKNALLSYKGSKSRVSWTADSFHNGRSQIAKINVKTRILEIYLALDPATLEGTVYRGKDVGSKKKYAETPFQYKIRTPRKFKWAMELVQRTCEEHGLSPIDIEPVAYDEQYPFDTTENLVARKLIKEYIRQEKPATTFELAEDHKTAVPDEDPSVIPANANFSWEFDNDMLNDPARNVEPEPAPEPEPVPVAEPVQEETEAPAAPTTVYKETVKVTEMRYTERYYANGEATVDSYETSRELTDGSAVEDTEPETVAEHAEDDGFSVDKFDGADPFADYRGDVLEDEPEADATEEAAEEVIEEEEAEEEIDEDELPVWFELGDSNDANEAEADDENAEDVEYEEVVEYVEADDENAEDVEYEEVVEYVEADDENVEDVEYEEVVEYVEADDENAEDVEYEEIVEYVEVDDENAEDVEYEEVVEYVEEEEAPAAPKAAANPDVAVISIRTLEANFAEGATVTLDKLKAVGLVLPTAKYLNVYGSGPISKALTVEANKFTLDAVIAIDEAGGNSIMLT